MNVKWVSFVSSLKFLFLDQFKDVAHGSSVQIWNKSIHCVHIKLNYDLISVAPSSLVFVPP